MNSHDHEFVSSIANRIVEFIPGGIIDKMEGFEDYLADSNANELREKAYKDNKRIILL